MAEHIGFEPMRLFPNDGLANRSLNHSGNVPFNLRINYTLILTQNQVKNLTSREGLEPSPHGFGDRHTAIILPRYIIE